MSSEKTSLSVWLRAMLYMLIVGGGWLFILPVLFLFLEGQTFTLRAMPWAIIGAGIFASGSTLGIVAGYYLISVGQGTPFPLDPTRELVTAGPYGYVRNPQAIAMVLTVTGEIITIQSQVLWILFPLTLVYLLGLAGPWEDRQLTQQHGERYMAYKRNIQNWIPTLRRYQA